MREREIKLKLSASLTCLVQLYLGVVGYEIRAKVTATPWRAEQCRQN